MSHPAERLAGDNSRLNTAHVEPLQNAGRILQAALHAWQKLDTAQLCKHVGYRDAWADIRCVPTLQAKLQSCGQQVSMKVLSKWVKGETTSQRLRLLIGH